MIQKSFDDINKADIDLLIDEKTSEFKTLEYKEKLPSSKDADKKEFLADITSFANASGGDIIYGIKAAMDSNGKKTGEPDKVVPIKGKTADETKLQIENIVRLGVAPRVKVHVKEISGYGNGGNGFVILIRIPQSFASPHMVTFKNTSRFYCRNSAGKYQLDVQEIRNAFLATDSQADRIRSFLQDRLAKIMADETPIPLTMPHRLALHILPLNSFFNQKRLNFSTDRDLTLNFRPIDVSGWDHRYNLDGFLTYRDNRETKLCDSYCQTFFNGTIEAVYADILWAKGGRKPQSGDTAFIASIAYEKYVIEAIRNYFNGYKALGVEAPVAISMALLGCKGAYMYTDFGMGLDANPIDRDVAILPEVQVASLDEDVPTIMRPIFDAVWNACGHPRSYNYTENGIWNVRSW
ncbi:MAG: ATP-binding protein [Planctomycetes bacterium]|nr:ATP-binding protein [Planctomycetota bacterium]